MSETRALSPRRRFTPWVSEELNNGRETVRDLIASISGVGSILDVGAGEGADLLAARELHPGAQCHALESWAPNVERLARHGIQSASINLERDIFPHADESIELIVANQVLEHVKEVFWILHEATRVLKTGGHLLLGVPNLASLHNRALLALGRQPSCIQTTSAHVRGFTEEGLRRLLGIWSGYRVVARQGANFYPFPPLLARPLARVFPGGAVGLFLLLKKERAYTDAKYLRYLDTARLATDYYTGPQSSRAWKS